ncbi:hypothetical protein BGW38_000062, partial [Lunasporangiospora selenospora]
MGGGERGTHSGCDESGVAEVDDDNIIDADDDGSDPKANALLLWRPFSEAETLAALASGFKDLVARRENETEHRGGEGDCTGRGRENPDRGRAGAGAEV